MDAALKEAFVEAYERPEALKAGFDLYRCFPQDEKDNSSMKERPVTVPVLYMRGQDDPCDLERYIAGFKESGIQDLVAAVIPGCGHFMAEEQPERVAEALGRFIRP